jgi:hypothetical protein
MTVKELIEALSKIPPYTDVVLGNGCLVTKVEAVPFSQVTDGVDEAYADEIVAHII